MFVKFNCFFQVAILYSALDYRMDDTVVPSAAGTRDFSHFLERSEWVRLSPTYLVCTEGFVLRVKRPWLEVDHLLTASGEV